MYRHWISLQIQIHITHVTSAQEVHELKIDHTDAISLHCTEPKACLLSAVGWH